MHTKRCNTTINTAGGRTISAARDRNAKPKKKPTRLTPPTQPTFLATMVVKGASTRKVRLASTPSSVAACSTVRVSVPTWSSVGESGNTPSSGTRP